MIDMIFSIIIDCNSKGKYDVWSQQKQNLSEEKQRELNELKRAIERLIHSRQVNIGDLFAKEKT